jgi:hypothetical protein
LKKLTLISLLSIIVLSQFGYYCFCTLQIYAAKESAKEQMLKQVPENLLTKISIQDYGNVIKWEEEGKEFSLMGAMYDVVKVKNENGNFFLLCINDAKEDEILAAIAVVVKNNSGSTSNSSEHQSVVKYSIPEWISECYNYNFSGISIITNKEYFNYSSTLHSGVIEISSPPPNFYI